MAYLLAYQPLHPVVVEIDLSLPERLRAEFLHLALYVSAGCLKYQQGSPLRGILGDERVSTALVPVGGICLDRMLLRSLAD